MSYGGVRKGAGRRSRFGCETKPMRVPTALAKTIEKFIEHKGYQLPLYESKVAAGSPTPADSQIETVVDLNAYLIKDPANTFLVRATGNSMINAGIYENSLLVVDKSVEATSGKIVVAAVDGQLTVKRLQKTAHGKFILIPENPDFEPIEVSEESDVHIWGVVKSIIQTV